MRPLGDRVIVARDDSANKTEGGLFIPEQAKEKPQKGKVVYVGPESKVKVGEKIIFSKYAGTEITLDGKDLLIMRDEDVIAVL